MGRQLGVLGPTEVHRDGRIVALRPRERDVLAALALRHPRATEADAVIDLLWPDLQPATARVSVQNHVARIRRALGADAVVTEGGSYRLGPGWTLDADEADALAARAHRSALAGDHHDAVAALDGVLALDRGDPYGDLGDHPSVEAVRARRSELRRAAEEDLVVALLGAGATRRAVAEGAQRATAEPFREVRWVALALALYRDGQRRESLRALQRGQTALRELVGLDGGPGLRRLETLVLDDDPRLLADPPAVLVGRSAAGIAVAGVAPARVGPVPDDGPPPDLPDLLASARAARVDARHDDSAALMGAAAAIAEERWGAADRRTQRIVLEQAEALRLAGDPAGTDVAWRVVRAADAAGDADLLAEGAIVLCLLGPLTAAGTLDEEVAAVLERAVAGCPTLTIRALCARQAALFYSMSGRIDRCRAHFERALVDARASGDRTVVLSVVGAAYLTLTHPDDWPRRADLAAERLALAESLGDDDACFGALHMTFSTQLVTADPLIRTTFVRQEQLARSLGSAARRWMAGYQRACLAHLDGRLDDALEIGEEIFAQAPVAPSRALAAYGMNLLVVRLAQGREQELVTLVDEAIEAQPGLPGWRAVAAWVAARAGDGERVQHEWAALEHGAALPPDTTWSGAAVFLGRAVAATSGSAADVATATALLTPYADLFTWYGTGTVGPFALALAELALAADDHAAARAHLARAQHLVDRLRAPVFQPDLDRVAARLAAG